MAGATGGGLLLQPTGGCTPPLPATSAHEGPMVEGRTECTANLLPVPSYTSPHDGAEEQGRGRGGAGWLAGYLGRTGYHVLLRGK
jgi:hypothetical protein